jgi:hypothetical protein
MPVERTARWAVALLGVVALAGLLSMHGLEAGASLRFATGHAGEHTHEVDCVGCDHLAHVAGVCLAVIASAVAVRRVAANHFPLPSPTFGAGAVAVVPIRLERPRGVPLPRVSNCVWIC